MTQLVLDLPDELATRLQALDVGQLPHVLDVGLRRCAARDDAFDGLTDVLENLARLPTPQEVLAMRPSATLSRRVDELLEKNRTVGLSALEQSWWKQFAYVEHLVSIAKARALLALQAQ